ncbi:MAG: hypothetical protein ACE5FU_13210 [Nitrospinota bacterium]
MFTTRKRRFWYDGLIYFLTLCFFSPGGIFLPKYTFAKENTKVKIIVKELESKGVDALLIETVTNLIKETVLKTGRYVVVSSGEKGQQMIVGTLEKADDTYTITLKLVDADTSKSINSHIGKVKEALAEKIEEFATMLVMDAPSTPGKVVSKDVTPPEVNHIPLYKKLGKSDMVIVATITDDTSVKEATLFYKNQDSESFVPVLMKGGSGGNYEGVISKNAVASGNIQYYIEAVDGSGNATNAGSISAPFLVSVEIPKVVPKKKKSNWWKWALGGVAAAGLAVALGGSGGGGGSNAPTSGGVSVSW